MAQTYTLDESAQKLGISSEEFKRKLKGEWKSLKSFRDGPTLRFRSADIDELARTLGQASDPGLQPGEAGILAGGSSEEIGLELAPLTPAPRLKAPATEKPLALDLDDSDDNILTLPSGDSGDAKKKTKSSGDSDVRLDRTPSKKDPAAKELTEEISLDLSGPRSGILKSPSSRKLSGARLKGPGSSKIIGSPGQIPGPKGQSASDDSSSEFELSLDSDSDSFELQLNTDSSEEVDLGGAVAQPGARGGQSGINLRKPADSGVSLEKSGAPDSESDIDFELSLDAPGASSSRLGGAKSGPKLVSDSDSEFELSLDDNSGVTDGIANDLDGDANKGDIFETDFELPVVSDEESASEVVAIDSADTDLENSDFDIAISDDDMAADDESASQVMLVDDEPVALDDEAPTVRKGGGRRASLADDDVLLDDLETDTGSSASAAMRRTAVRDDDAPVRTVVAKPATWGPLPALLLMPCLIVVLVGGMMSFEVLRGMWGYQQPSKTSDSLVRGVAGTLGLKASE